MNLIGCDKRGVNRTMVFRLGLIQMDIVWANPEENLAKAGKMIHSAASRNCSMVVLPELWSTALCGSRIAELAADTGERVRETIREWATRFEMVVAAGSIAWSEGEDRVSNLSMIIDTEGDVAGWYKKAHLFRPMQEQKYVVPGDGFSVVKTSLGVLGPLICYDIRFPEAARKLTLSGADMLVVPANFPDPRRDVWRTLLLARDMENQVFVCGVNRIGQDPKYSYFGNSMVIDPGGQVLVEGNREEELLVADIDLTRLNEVRKALPALSDRRPDLY